MALVAPPVVTGGLVALMMSHTSLVLGAGPLRTGPVGGSASLPGRMLLVPKRSLKATETPIVLEGSSPCLTQRSSPA